MSNEYLNQILSVFFVVFDIFMVISPNIGFIAQIIKFRQVKSSKGFSKFLSFIILIANILRIFFWVGKRFPLPLLYQSILLIFMQIIVLRECLKYSSTNNNDNKIFGQKEKSSKQILILDFKNFWNWPFLIDYIFFLCMFVTITGFLSQLIGYNNMIYVEILGAASATVEATIALPQIYQNFKTKNTESLSQFMIYTWVIGDSIKTFYFVETKSPVQLICCGVFQLMMDMVILMQIFYYSSNNMKKCGDIDEMKNLKIEEKIHKKQDEIISGGMKINDEEDEELDQKIGFI
jgi:uncharacterized protein with PQ loop repeat